MHLLTYRPSSRTLRLELPDGSTRAVKVTVNDAHDVQHVETDDAIHGTARPAPVAMAVRTPAPQRRGMVLRNLGMPKMRQAFRREVDTGLWAPLPGTEQLR